MAPLPLQDRVGKGVDDALITEATQELASAPVMPFYESPHLQAVAVAFEGMQPAPIIKRVADAWIAVHLSLDSSMAQANGT